MRLRLLAIFLLLCLLSVTYNSALGQEDRQVKVIIESETDTTTQYVAILTAIGGILTFGYGIYQYRQSRILRRQGLLFNLIKEYDESKEMELAKLILDDFRIDPLDGWTFGENHYYKYCLRNILRSHTVIPVRDKGEQAIRESFDHLLEFFGKLEYLIQVGLMTEKELEYFKYFLKRAAANEAVKKYITKYEFPLYKKLSERGIVRRGVPDG